MLAEARMKLGSSSSRLPSECSRNNPKHSELLRDQTERQLLWKGLPFSFAHLSGFFNFLPREGKGRALFPVDSTHVLR